MKSRILSPALGGVLVVALLWAALPARASVVSTDVHTGWRVSSGTLAMEDDDSGTLDALTEFSFQGVDVNAELGLANVTGQTFLLTYDYGWSAASNAFGGANFGASMTGRTYADVVYQAVVDSTLSFDFTILAGGWASTRTQVSIYRDQSTSILTYFLLPVPSTDNFQTGVPYAGTKNYALEAGHEYLVRIQMYHNFYGPAQGLYGTTSGTVDLDFNGAVPLPPSFWPVLSGLLPILAARRRVLRAKG